MFSTVVSLFTKLTDLTIFLGDLFWTVVRIGKMKTGLKCGHMFSVAFKRNILFRARSHGSFCPPSAGVQVRTPCGRPPLLSATTQL